LIPRGLGAVVDECAAGAAELVVEGDRGGEANHALDASLPVEMLVRRSNARLRRSLREARR